MPSTLSWLDTSAEEQRRVRELIALYTQAESRDELGIGQIRDAFSDGLFPGTSTIHTRARYFLFIPWLYSQGAKTRSGGALSIWADKQERKLIGALKSAGIGAGDGLIGRVAGAGVKTLPSTIYWSALGRYGIRTHDLAPDMLGKPSATTTGDGELALRIRQDWHATLPSPPDGFPNAVKDGMSLRPEEAEWLRERMLETTTGTMLAHLLTDSTRLEDGDAFPWDEPACLSADRAPAALLQHGRLFSLAINGAALTYNLLIAEKYEAAGLTLQENPVDRYRDALISWSDDLEAAGALLRGWDRQQMWDQVRGLNPRVGLMTRTFVDTWLDVVVSGQGRAVADNIDIRCVIATRERQQKKSQSRLQNDKLLRNWSGASGSSRLVYRWPQVRRIVDDIREGVTGAGA